MLPSGCCYKCLPHAHEVLCNIYIYKKTFTLKAYNKIRKATDIISHSSSEKRSIFNASRQSKLSNVTGSFTTCKDAHSPVEFSGIALLQKSKPCFNTETYIFKHAIHELCLYHLKLLLWTVFEDILLHIQGITSIISFSWKTHWRYYLFDININDILNYRTNYLLRKCRKKANKQDWLSIEPIFSWFNP